MARDLETILSGNLQGRQVALTFDLDPALPALVVGDVGRLKQVLINLGSNAIKFTAQGEVQIRVRVRRRHAEKVVLAFEVIDTGIGLTPEQQQRVFSGFSQAEASTSRRFGGTGLGLAISQRLVLLMGGELKVNSRLGEGSTFYFDVQLALSEAVPADVIPTAPVERTADVSAPLPDLAGLRVLLVEDNLINQMVASQLLSAQGARVQLAENGQLAVDALRANPTGFDVVLMDLQMPVMDGLQATRHIRQQLKLTQLPIIAMTANVMESDRADCLAVGMNDHIGKPFNVTDLVARLRHWTGDF
jgi:CheY-like chemotaxis protein